MLRVMFKYIKGINNENHNFVDDKYNIYLQNTLDWQTHYLRTSKILY